MKTAIVTVSDEKYLPAACCTLLSCARAGGVRSNLFLVADNVSAISIKAACGFLRQHDVPVDVIDHRSEQAGYRVNGYITFAAYTRLSLDEHFDGRWDRLLYLDADTRVLAPLRPLLHADLCGRVLGAVGNLRDVPEPIRNITADAPYFNSGVLLFDWPATLKCGLLNRARGFARENPHLCEWHDQDALNAVVGGLWTPLDQRWNFTSFRARRLPRHRPYVLHYTGIKKPWGTKRYPRHLADALWYRRTLRNSPWPDFAVPVPLRAFFQAARWQYRIRASKRARWHPTPDGQRLEPKP
jgi:lipopolysaccharide biosynthesis glycosyltransferase